MTFHTCPEMHYRLFSGALVLAACGDPGGAESGGTDSVTTTGASGGTDSVTTTGASTSTGLTSTGTTTTTGGATATGEDPGTTAAPAPCSRVHQGDLHIGPDDDLAEFADLGQVTGSLYLTLGDRDVTDLSFLACLHKVWGSLTIHFSNRLESTEGLGNLVSLGGLTLTDNPNLRVVTGFDAVLGVKGLMLFNNPLLEAIELDSLKSVDWLRIGRCQGDLPAANLHALVDLTGFSGLTTVDSLYVEGNEALQTADLLDALAANDAAMPLRVATFRWNPLLPEADVHAGLDALGVELGEVCGNAGGDPDCFCVVGE